MNDELDPNPYAAPHAPVIRHAGKTSVRLAERSDRFAAALLDNLIYLPCCIPLFLGNAWQFLTEDEVLEPDAKGAVGLLLAFLMWAGIVGYQCFLLHQNGWTVGKRVMRIKVVDSSGRRADTLRLVVVRTFVPALISSCCNLLSLVDVLMIFGESRRCLHDYMAGTIVVRA